VDKVKKKLMLLGILSALILSACTPSNLEYLRFGENPNPIIASDKTYDLTFFVINPNTITFTGTVEYEYDTNCLYTAQKIDTIKVTPQEFQKPILKSFSVRQEVRNIQSNLPNQQSECLIKPVKISTILKDDGGDIKGKFDVSLSIVR